MIQWSWARSIILKCWGRLNKKQNSSAQIDVIEKNDIPTIETNALWKKCASDYYSIVERRADYLQWKYIHHPILPYTILHEYKNGLFYRFMNNPG